MKKVGLYLTEEQAQFLHAQPGSMSAWVRTAIDDRRFQGARLQALIDRLDASLPDQQQAAPPAPQPKTTGPLVGLRRGIGEEE